MKKDTLYSMRMSKMVREALTRAAKKECRTVASLLDKIITDYLQKTGFLPRPAQGVERRRFQREKIPLPSKTFLKVGDHVEVIPSVIRDISMGGAMVVYPKDTETKFAATGILPQFELCLDLPLTDESLCFNCNTRHMRESGNEIQIGAAFHKPDRADLRKLKSYLL